MKTFLILALMILGIEAQAYYSTIDTGELLKKGQYRLSTEGNVLFNDLNGGNLVARIDTGFNEDSNFRALIGTGVVGFQTGLLYKWIPIPDFQDQPAIGILGGFIYARADDVSYLSLRLHPLVSKHFKSDIGDLTPYASLPFGITGAKGTHTFPLQLTFGNDWKPNGLNKLSFITEFGFNLHESYSYVSLAALLIFDEEQGIKFE